MYDQSAESPVESCDTFFFHNAVEAVRQAFVFTDYRNDRKACIQVIDDRSCALKMQPSRKLNTIVPIYYFKKLES